MKHAPVEKLPEVLDMALSASMTFATDQFKRASDLRPEDISQNPGNTFGNNQNNVPVEVQIIQDSFLRISLRHLIVRDACGYRTRCEVVCSFLDM